MAMNSLKDEAQAPPTGTEEHRLPGVGIAGRNARATNLSEAKPSPPDANTDERSTNFTAIEAMRARSTAASVILKSS